MPVPCLGVAGRTLGDKEGMKEDGLAPIGGGLLSLLLPLQLLLPSADKGGGGCR